MCEVLDAATCSVKEEKNGRLHLCHFRMMFKTALHTNLSLLHGSAKPCKGQTEVTGVVGVSKAKSKLKKIEINRTKTSM